MPEVAALLAEGAAAAGCHGSSSSNSSGSSSSDSDSGSSGAGAAPQRRKLVLVFGREVEGLLDHEVDACDYTLSIPIGRLQGGRLHVAVPWKGQWSRPNRVWLQLHLTSSLETALHASLSTAAPCNAPHCPLPQNR